MGVCWLCVYIVSFGEKKKIKLVILFVMKNKSVFFFKINVYKIEC